MIRAGIPERVAMTISGHKTRSILDRYNIVSLQDLKLAARRMEEATQNAREQHERQQKQTEGHNWSSSVRSTDYVPSILGCRMSELTNAGA
jgi:hypothetical protein